MSVQISNDTDEQTAKQTDEILADNTRDLCHWLDEQPHFQTVEHTHRVRSKDSGTAVDWGRRDRDVTEAQWLSPDYEETGRACYNSQNEVMDAWESMQYPSHRTDTVQGVTGAYLYTWSSSGTAPVRRRRRRGMRNDDNEQVINFDAVQHPEGHGVVQHYSTIAAIRTRNGLVLANEQDYGGGFARVTRPDNTDATIPLTGVEDILSDKPEDLYDITEIVRDSIAIEPRERYDAETGEWHIEEYRPTNTIDRPRLLRLSSGAAICLLIDSTANNDNERKCGFYIPAAEAPLYDRAQDAADSLQPITVKQALDAGRFTLTPADEFAGSGATFGNDDLLGETIIRQGEWYLVPMPDDWMPQTPTYKGLPKARRDSKWDFSHVDTAEFYGVDDIIGEFPEGCPACDATSFEIEAREPKARCTECGESFVFAGHDPAEYVDESLLNTYKEAMDTLGSHVPRDLAVTDDGIFIRGTFRHAANEHQMLNLDDRWHLAVENTRDVTVFDLDLDRGGVARYE